MKYILTSNSYLHTKSWSQEFDMDPSKMRVAFIDTAAEVYNKDEADWLKADRAALVEVGFTVEDYTLTNKTKEDLKKELVQFDVLFVSGGNTFYLLEKANKSGFTQLIQDDFFAEKIYVGSSAGSVLLSNDIDIIKFMDSPDKADLERTKAIGILDFPILAHWGNTKFKPRFDKLLDYAYENSTNFLTLSEDEYLVIAENEFRFVK